MKRFVNDGVLPKGPAELAARYGAELAAVRSSADAAEGVGRSGSGESRVIGNGRLAVAAFHEASICW